MWSGSTSVLPVLEELLHLRFWVSQRRRLARMAGFYTHATLHQLMETVNLDDAGIRFPLLYQVGRRSCHASRSFRELCIGHACRLIAAY